MTLQTLGYFIALAEQKSFTDAASACFVSQPALSRAIAALEKELDCVLVDRNKRKTVMLTPAGETLLIEARRIMQQMETMKKRVQRVDQQTRGEFVIGYINYGHLRDFRVYCHAAIDALKAQRMTLTTVYGSMQEICERVTSGELDCALVPYSCVSSLTNCEVYKAFRTPMSLIVPKENKWFAKDEIYLEELNGEGFVMFDPSQLLGVYMGAIRMCEECGFTPRVVGVGHKLGDVVSQVHQHGTIAIGSMSLNYAAAEDLKFFSAKSREKNYESQMAIITRRNPANPAVAIFLSALQKNYDSIASSKE